MVEAILEVPQPKGNQDIRADPLKTRSAFSTQVRPYDVMTDEPCSCDIVC